MDGAVVIVVTLFLYFKYMPKVSPRKGSSRSQKRVVLEPEKVVENPMLNPEMVHDEGAFMRIANELGFH